MRVNAPARVRVYSARKPSLFRVPDRNIHQWIQMVTRFDCIFLGKNAIEIGPIAVSANEQESGA
jgi:hypothetical protein